MLRQEVRLRWTPRTPRRRGLPSMTWSWSPRGVSLTTKAWGVISRLTWPAPASKKRRRRR
jgi:hypothetical protein